MENKDNEWAVELTGLTYDEAQELRIALTNKRRNGLRVFKKSTNETVCTVPAANIKITNHGRR